MNGSDAGNIVLAIIIAAPALCSILLCAHDPDEDPGDGRIDLAIVQAFLKNLAPIWVIAGLWILMWLEDDLLRMKGGIPEQLMIISYVGIVTLSLTGPLVRNARRWGAGLWRTIFTLNGLFVMEISMAVLFYYLHFHLTA